MNFRCSIMTFLGVALLLLSCQKEEKDCSNYLLRESYDLRNLISDTETFEKINGKYIDKDNTNLDNFFDISSVTSSMKSSGFFEKRTHFKMNFNKDLTGFFQDSNGNMSLSYQYNYIQDSIVIINSNNANEYTFYLNNSCKLEYCTFLVSTFKSKGFKDYEIIYTTDCLNKSYNDIASEFLQIFGQNAPDTIGINMYQLFEK